MTENQRKKQKTPAQERAEIGTPAGEDAEKGRQRHGTQPLTQTVGGGASDREREAVEGLLEADQSADPENAGQRVRGSITEDALDEEGAEQGIEDQLTGSRLTGATGGHAETT